MNIAIVDDESLFQNMIKSLIEKKHNLSFFCDGRTFLKQTQSFDVVILDINLPDMDGIEIAKQLKRKEIYILFLTSMSERVYDAFGINVYKFLLKENLNSLPSILDEIESEITSKSDLSLSSSIGEIKLSFNKILYFEYLNRHLILHTHNDQINICNSSLCDICTRLDSRFIRIHRSYCVNLDYVISFKRKELVLNNHVVLPIGRSEIKLLKGAYIKRHFCD